jgi:hypothetical protein
MSRTTLKAATREPSPAGFPEMALLRRRVAEIDPRFRPLLVEHTREWKQSFGFDIEVVRQSRV